MEIEDRLSALLAGAMLAAADRFAATGNPNPDDSLRVSVADALGLAWREAAIAEARKVMAEFKGGFDHLETKDEESLFERIVREFVEHYGTAAIDAITDATREQMIRMLQQGLKDGLGTQAIAARMREKIPGLAKLRAHVIARTETHSASQFASNAVARESRLPLEKEWVSISDHRTRDFGEGDGVVDEFSHRSMNGVRVVLDQPFMVPRKDGSKEALMFPGDPNASAGNRVMCRCVQVYRRVGR